MKIAKLVIGSLLLSLCTAGLSARADQLTILTSFPKEIMDTYKKAFEKKYPETKMEVLNKQTSASIAYLRETPAGQRPDIFWASAPDAFEVLAAEKLLEKAPSAWNPAIPEKIGAFPINDPEGFYRGQALAGYGIMWNTRYMKAKKLPIPAEWADLTRPVYFGHVAMSSPSRSGTTHLTVETILQGEGWLEGWRQLLMISGNCAAITERSFGVPDGVNSGQYGIGLVIDFFGLSAKYSGFPVEFAYPSMTAIVPANIGLVAGAKNSAAGKKFMAYSLSEEGQALLLDPKISRLPVLTGIYTTKNLPSDFPNIYRIAKRAKVQFNTEASRVRYGVVSSLFDQTITFQIKEIQQVTKAIHEAERSLAKKSNREAAALITEARRIAFTPVLSVEDSTKKPLLDLYQKKKGDAAVTRSIAELEEGWSNQAKANYARAGEIAKQAMALLK